MKREPFLRVNLTAEEYKTLFNHDINARFVEPTSELISYGITSQQRNHWKKLHTTRFTPQEFEAWIASIPGCSTCQRDFRKLIETNTPRFDDWQRWTWEVHNAVNAKLGKPEIEWNEACELWNWKPQKE
jgi:hypothetical protein